MLPNKLYKPKDAGHPASNLAISETVAKSICAGTKDFLRWNGKEPLTPGYDPVPIFIVDKTDPAAVRFHLVNANSGIADTTLSFVIDLRNRSHCHQGAPSIDVGTATTTDAIIILMICPTYYDAAVAKEDSTKKFKDVATAANIDLPGGKWPKSELASAEGQLNAWVLDQIITEAVHGSAISLVKIKQIFALAQQQNPLFTPPSSLPI